MGLLFVALAPALRLEDDFYSPAQSTEFFDPFLEGLEIPAPAEEVIPGADPHAPDIARLAEFQRRGYYLAYLSECPIRESDEPSASTIARLGPTLIRRIRFNYKPKHIVPLGEDLIPFIDILKTAGVGPVLTLDQRLPLPTPRTGNPEWAKLFHGAVSTAALRDNLSPGYGRIEVTESERKLGVGGNK
jgi:hypothetical protein